MRYTTPALLRVTSNAFEQEGVMPVTYTCEGQAISPPLTIAGIPANTQTLAIIMEDRDAPQGVFDHWIVWNIPSAENISANAEQGINGLNSAGKTGYFAPCPPVGAHRYYFHVYALDTRLVKPGIRWNGQ